MPKEIIKIGLAVVQGDSLLLVRKWGTSFYILPGGKPESGEDDLAALAREIDEELGCDLDLTRVQYLGAFQDRAAGQPNVQVTVRLYAGTLIGHPSPQAEIEQLIWFNPRTGEATELAPSLTNSIVPYLVQSGLVKQNLARS
jgi:8-oxo-dGTP diphosphatase